jgi:hypothetical protein
MAMQMLVAGGLEAVTDALRAPDADNPHGYLEYEPVKQLRADKSWVASASGKAVKVIHLLLPELPEDLDYRVIFMERDVREVVRSQAAMLTRSGKPGGNLAPERMAAMYDAQLKQVFAWVAARPNFRLLRLSHASCIADPAQAAKEINTFLGGRLDEVKMVAAVDPSLHRNRV